MSPENITIMKYTLLLLCALLSFGVTLGLALLSANTIYERLERKLGFGVALFLGTLSYLMIVPVVGGPLFILLNMLAKGLGIR